MVVIVPLPLGGAGGQMRAHQRGPTTGWARGPQGELPETQRQPGDGRQDPHGRRRGVGPRHFGP